LSDTAADHAWDERGRPARLERRYEFGSYQRLRDFLDRAAEISERDGLYPDMGFGRDYVNMTIHADEGSGSLEPQHHRLAAALDELYVAADAG
jgi:pterin-4a-carbinolamine dehydratase